MPRSRQFKPGRVVYNRKILYVLTSSTCTARNIYQVEYSCGHIGPRSHKLLTDPKTNKEGLCTQCARQHCAATLHAKLRSGKLPKNETRKLLDEIRDENLWAHRIMNEGIGG